MTCSLVCTDPVVIGHEPASLSVCVYEILGKGKFRITVEDESYAAKAWGYRTSEFKLEQNKHGYLILCVNFDKGALGNFKLLV